jgi:uncharacterized protein YjiS (DUF1127 family)
MIKAQCTTLQYPAPSISVQILQGAAGFVLTLVRLPLTVFEVLLVWQDRATERYRLQEIDSHQLKDIGLSPADIYKETSLPFWRRS